MAPPGSALPACLLGLLLLGCRGGKSRGWGWGWAAGGGTDLPSPSPAPLLLSVVLAPRSVVRSVPSAVPPALRIPSSPQRWPGLCSSPVPRVPPHAAVRPHPQPVPTRVAPTRGIGLPWRLNGAEQPRGLERTERGSARRVAAGAAWGCAAAEVRSPPASLSGGSALRGGTLGSWLWAADSSISLSSTFTGSQPEACPQSCVFGWTPHLREGDWSV